MTRNPLKIEMLTKLTDLIDRIRGRRQRETGRPFNLTKAELNDLKILTSSPEWSTYLGLLDTISKLKVEGLLVEKDENAWDRGFISGLRKAGLVPAEIIQNVEQEQTSKHERAERSARRATDRRRLATFGSEWWRAEHGNGSKR